MKAEGDSVCLLNFGINATFTIAASVVVLTANTSNKLIHNKDITTSKDFQTVTTNKQYIVKIKYFLLDKGYNIL